MILFNLDVLITAMINGIFVGGGAAIGTYFVTKHLIRNLERLEEKVKQNGKNGVE